VSTTKNDITTRAPVGRVGIVLDDHVFAHGQVRPPGRDMAQGLHTDSTMPTALRGAVTGSASKLRTHADTEAGR
jgi:hypothetical protein